MSTFKFTKQERLSNKKRFDHLFEDGNMIKSYPIKLVYHNGPQKEGVPPLQFAFAVPKRNFRKAVDRNYIRRRIKESFRLHKHLIYQAIEDKKLSVYGIFIFVDRNKRQYSEIDEAVQKAIKKLIQTISTVSN